MLLTVLTVLVTVLTYTQSLDGFDLDDLISSLEAGAVGATQTDGGVAHLNGVANGGHDLGHDIGHDIGHDLDEID